MTVQPTQQDIDRKVRRWVAQGSRLDTDQCLPGYEGRPIPLQEFAVVTLLNHEINGSPWHALVADKDDPTVFHEGMVAEVMATYSVRWHRRTDRPSAQGNRPAPVARMSAGERAAGFELWARSPQGRMMSQYAERSVPGDDTAELAASKRVCFVLRTVSMIRQLDELVGSDFEEVRGCDVDICYFLTEDIIPAQWFDDSAVNAEALAPKLRVHSDLLTEEGEE